MELKMIAKNVENLKKLIKNMIFSEYEDTDKYAPFSILLYQAY